MWIKTKFVMFASLLDISLLTMLTVLLQVKQACSRKPQLTNPKDPCKQNELLLTKSIQNISDQNKFAGIKLDYRHIR